MLLSPSFGVSLGAPNPPGPGEDLLDLTEPKRVGVYRAAFPKADIFPGNIYPQPWLTCDGSISRRLAGKTNSHPGIWETKCSLLAPANPSLPHLSARVTRQQHLPFSSSPNLPQIPQEQQISGCVEHLPHHLHVFPSLIFSFKSREMKRGR